MHQEKYPNFEFRHSKAPFQCKVGETNEKKMYPVVNCGIFL